MSFYEKYGIQPCKPPIFSRQKCSQQSSIINHDLNVYMFPMSNKYYKKNQKKLESSMLDQMINNVSISPITEFSYDHENEVFLVIKQDFISENSLNKLLSDTNTIFTEIHVIDFLKQIFLIYSSMDFLKKSIPGFGIDKLYVYPTERKDKLYKIECFFCEEGLLTTKNTDHNFFNNKPDVKEVAMIAMKMLKKTQDSVSSPFKELKNKEISLESFNISKVLKDLLNKMIAEESKRPSFLDLKEFCFFNPKIIKPTINLSNNISMSGKEGKLSIIRHQTSEEDLPLEPLFTIATKSNIERSICNFTKSQQEYLYPIKSKLSRIKKLVKFLSKKFSKDINLDEITRRKVNRLLIFLRSEMDKLLNTIVNFKDLDPTKMTEYQKDYEKNKTKLKSINEVLETSASQSVFERFLNKWNNSYSTEYDKTDNNINESKIYKKIQKFLAKNV